MKKERGKFIERQIKDLTVLSEAGAPDVAAIAYTSGALAMHEIIKGIFQEHFNDSEKCTRELLKIDRELEVSAKALEEYTRLKAEEAHEAHKESKKEKEKDELTKVLHEFDSEVVN